MTQAHHLRPPFLEKCCLSAFSTSEDIIQVGDS